MINGERGKIRSQSASLIALLATIAALFALTCIDRTYQTIQSTSWELSESKALKQSLPVDVNHHVMQELLQFMHDKNDDPKYSKKWDGARIMLEFLLNSAPTMFPLVGTVPVSADEEVLKSIDPRNFKGMEDEDRHIYQRFFNENTLKCHTFGDAGLFESGAYKGVSKSNTYFFEKHFNFSSTLVEASKDNWDELDKAVAAHRPYSKVFHSALCSVGDSHVCLEADPRRTAKNSVTRSSCSPDAVISCYDYDDTLHYSFISLDIEGFEWEFVKFRNLQADIVMVEVIQWLRNEKETLTAVEFVAYMARLGYYLYASPGHMVGKRNFVFLSRDLVDDCFTEYIISSDGDDSPFMV